MVGRRCCVPRCKSNYDSSKVYNTVFRFPRDEELKKVWLRKIPRDNYVPTVNSVVCVKHFHEEDVITHDVLPSKEGDILIPRATPKLKQGALPIIFPGCPAYLNEPRKSERASTIKRKQKIQKLDDEDFNKWIDNNKITNVCLFFESSKKEKPTLIDGLQKDGPQSSTSIPVVNIKKEKIDEETSPAAVQITGSSTFPPKPSNSDHQILPDISPPFAPPAPPSRPFVSNSRPLVVPPIPPPKKQKLAEPLSKQDELLSLACKYLQKWNESQDNIPTIAKVWGEKLIVLDPQQRLFAEKAINDVLFEASLGNLNRYSVKINEDFYHERNTSVHSFISTTAEGSTNTFPSPIQEMQET